MRLFITITLFILSFNFCKSQEYLKLVGKYKFTNVIVGTRQDTVSHYIDTPIQFSSNNTIQIKKDSIIINYFEPVKWKIVKEVDIAINTIDLLLKDKDGKICLCYIFYPYCEIPHYRISILDSEKLNYLNGILVPIIKK